MIIPSNKTLAPQSLRKSKWFRFVFSVALALILAVILLLIPITASTIQIPVVSPSGETIDLPLPFGAKLVRATGGLTITKVSPPTVNQGEVLTYTLLITNNTGQDITSGMITDVMPLNTVCRATEGSTSPPWAGLCSSNAAGWILLYSPPTFQTPFTNNTTSVVTVSVNVAQPLPDQSTIINNSYGISTTDGVLTDFGLPVTTIVNAPAWQIGKSVIPTPTVQPGDTMTYTITVTNSGHLTTTGDYTITDALPVDTDFVSASSPGTFDGSNVIWVLSTPVGINESVTVSYTVAVTQPLTNGVEIVNQTYSITGGNVYNQVFGAPVRVSVITPVTLTVTKLDTPDPVQAGQLIDYTLIVTNDASSKGPASNVVVTDTVPANTSFVDAGFVSPASGSYTNLGGVITWTLATPDPLLIGNQAVLSMTVRVDSPLTNNTVITNEAYGAAVSNELFTVNGVVPVTTVVESAPILTITKEGLPETVSAGEQLTYTIRYTNSGNANATNVLIADTFPASTTFQSEDSNPVVSGTPTANGRQWNINFLPGNGGNGLITLTLAVLSPQNPGTVLTNVVSITSSEVLTPALFTETNLISSTPQLHIRKTADPSPVAVGSTLTYTLIFSNSGNADAAGVVMTDVLDSNVSFVDATGGGVHNSGVVTWTGLSVPAGGSDQTALITVTVASTLPHNSILSNNVEIAVDSITATASITTLVQAPALTITKIVSPSGVVRAGDTIEYTIIYTNTGPITAPNVLITDTFPVSITNVVSSTASSDGDDPAPQPTSFVWLDNQVPPNGGFGLIIITGQVITSPWASGGGIIDNSVIAAGNGYSATTAVSNEGRPGLPVTVTVAAVPASTTVGTPIAVTATAVDAYGNDVFDGTAITLTTSLAGSAVTPPVGNTSAGTAAATLTSNVAGTTTVAAQIFGTGGLITNTTVATFTPGPAHHFNLAATSPQTAGVTFPITITAVDSFGNVVNTVNQAITISDTTGTIIPTSVTLVNGVTTTNFIVTQATSPALDTITAISGTITGAVNVVILPNTPTTLTVTVNPATIRVCQTANVTTTITDNFGNPISNKSVNLSISPGASTDFSPNPGNTNSAGIFTSILTGRTAASPALIQGTILSPILTDLTSLNVITPAVPTNLTLTVAPNPLATGGNTATITATVTDCLGASAGQVVTFTVSNPALAFFTPDPFVATTNASGIATATLTSGSTDGTVVVTATAGSLVQTVNVTLQTAVLTITKTADPVSGTEVRPGQRINYTLQVINNGTGAANNITITDVLPAGVNFASVVSCGSGATCTGGSTTTVTVPTLGASQSIAATIQVAVTAPTSGTIISNQATVRSGQTSLITSNVVAHTVTTATTDLFLPIIFKDFVVAPDLRIRPGSFTITGGVVRLVVENIGTASTGEGFWVDFYVNPTTLPNNSTLGGNRRWEQVGSTQGIAWPVPALSAGQSVTLTSDGSSDVAPAPAPLSNWTGSTNNPYAFVDSYAQENVSYVEILESNENNNMAQPDVVAASGLEVEPSSVPDLTNLPPRWKP